MVQCQFSEIIQEKKIVFDIEDEDLCSNRMIQCQKWKTFSAADVTFLICDPDVFLDLYEIYLKFHVIKT